MSHAHVALFDNSIRGAWYSQGPFALSTALRTSASLGTAKRSENRDSSTPRNVHGQIERGLWWIRSVN